MISKVSTHLNRFDPFLWGPTGHGSLVIAVAPNASNPVLQIWFDGQDPNQFNPAGTVGTNITQWTDKSATAHNAAPIGATTTRPMVTSSLATNNHLCLYFDGSDGLSSPMGSSIQSKSAAGVIFVAKANASNTNMQFIEGAIKAGSNYSDAGGFNVFQSGSYGYKVRFAGSTATTTTKLPDTNWHIFTLLFDGSGATNADKVKFYIDGAQQTLTFTVNAGTTTSATITDIIMGVDDTKGANFLTGFFGEMTVYNAAITESERLSTELYFKNKWGL